MARQEDTNYDHYIYIGIGSNLGDRLGNILQALQMMQARAIEVIRCASLYETKAWGFESNDMFYNTVTECAFNHSPEELLVLLKEIESQMGRAPKQSAGYESRVIDLDILLFKNQCIHVKNLQIPHPEMCKRNFVLYPMEELVNSHIFSTVGKSFKLLINELMDDSDLFVVCKAPFIKQ